MKLSTIPKCQDEACDMFCVSVGKADGAEVAYGKELSRLQQ